MGRTRNLGFVSDSRATDAVAPRHGNDSGTARSVVLSVSSRHDISVTINEVPAQLRPLHQKVASNSQECKNIAGTHKVCCQIRMGVPQSCKTSQNHSLPVTHVY